MPLPGGISRGICVFLGVATFFVASMACSTGPLCWVWSSISKPYSGSAHRHSQVPSLFLSLSRDHSSCPCRTFPSICPCPSAWHRSSHAIHPPCSANLSCPCPLTWKLHEEKVGQDILEQDVVCCRKWSKLLGQNHDLSSWLPLHVVLGSNCDHQPKVAPSFELQLQRLLRHWDHLLELHWRQLHLLHLQATSCRKTMGLRSKSKPHSRTTIHHRPTHPRKSLKT